MRLGGWVRESNELRNLFIFYGVFVVIYASVTVSQSTFAHEFSVMAEMSSLSKSPFLKNVTVTPNVFELKKWYRFCASPSGCANSHHNIILCNLAYLKCVSEARIDSRYGCHRSFRDFARGNYSISVVNFNQEEAKPMVIFHYENLDPSLLVTALLDRKDKNKEISAVKKRQTMLGTMDRPSSTRSVNSCWYKESINKHQTWNDGNCAQKTSASAPSLKLVWKFHPTDVGNTADIQTPHLDGLFCFLNCGAWFEYSTLHRSYSDMGTVEISALTNGIYQLQAMNETIGVAIHPLDVFGDAEVFSVAIQDTSRNCLAIVLHGLEEHDYNGFAPLLLPKESFLYENVYRSFYEFGEEIENAYYGNDEDNQFARLPDTIFVKILSYLPWRQRIQCRRVNKRWRAVANLAMAIDTKIIDSSDERFKGMRAEDLNIVLPIVSNYVEEFTWPGTFNFGDIRQVQLFPKLRKIHISDQTPDFDGFFSMLNKCPNLKELTAPIPRRQPSSICIPGPYIQVEKLSLTNRSTLTDPWLIEISDYFPKLVSLRIDGYQFLSSSCISAVAEKYGETLTRLEIEDIAYKLYLWKSTAASMIGAVTGFGSCPNLEHLSLVGTAFISDPCMAALAAGCPKLTTLDIYGSCTVTNEGLAALASLPNLKRLDLSYVGSGADLSFGITQLAKAGHLEQLLIANAPHPSAACLKTCVRYCRQLKFVDISGSTADLTIDDAKEIIQLYGTWGLNSRLIIRSGNLTWRQEAVRTVRNDVIESFNRRFIVARPNHRLASKWAPEDGSDPADYEGFFFGDSDYEDEESAHGAVGGDIDDYDYSYDGGCRDIDSDYACSD